MNDITANAANTGESRVGDIGQIAVTVRDVATSLPFYRDTLGLRFLFSPSPTLAFLAAGSVRLMLSTPQGAGTVGANSVLYFHVADIETTYHEIVARGAVTDPQGTPHLVAKMPDHDLWMGFVRDPDGNLIGIMEEKRA